MHFESFISFLRARWPPEWPTELEHTCSLTAGGSLPSSGWWDLAELKPLFLLCSWHLWSLALQQQWASGLISDVWVLYSVLHPLLDLSTAFLLHIHHHGFSLFSNHLMQETFTILTAIEPGLKLSGSHCVVGFSLFVCLSLSPQICYTQQSSSRCVSE